MAVLFAGVAAEAPRLGGGSSVHPALARPRIDDVVDQPVRSKRQQVQKVAAQVVSLKALHPELIEEVLAYIPMPMQVAMSVGGGMVHFWQAGDLAVHDLPGSVHIVDIKFLPTGDRFFVARADGSAMVWCGRTRQVLFHLQGGHRQLHIHEAQVFPDGHRVVTLAADLRLVIWNATSGKMLLRIELLGHCGEHRFVRVVLGGRAVATGISERTGDPAVIWDAENGTVRHALLQPEGAMLFLDATPCGRKLVTTSLTTAYLWDAQTGSLQRSIESPAERLYGVGASEGGATVVFSHRERVFVMNGSSGELITQISTESRVMEFALISGDVGVAVFSDRGITVWDAANATRLRTLDTGVGTVYRVAQTPGRPIVAACGGLPAGAFSDAWTVVWASVWDVASGRRVYSRLDSHHQYFLGTPTPPCSIAVGPWGSMLDFLRVPALQQPES